MSQDNSQAWRMEDLLPGDNMFPNGQDNSGEVPIGMFESGSDEECFVQTPEQKPNSQKGASLDDTTETYLSSGNESSDISAKEGAESVSSSSSSSDAESGTYMPKKKHLLHHVNGAGILQPKLMEPEDDTLDLKENLPTPIGEEGMVKEKGFRYEEELLEKVAAYEVELKSAKAKLQDSQEEVAKLKYENLTLVEELGRTTEKLWTSEASMKEMEINLKHELQEGQDRLNEKLELANQSVDKLQADLALERRRGSELQAMFVNTTSDLSDYTREVEELKLALHDAQRGFSEDKSQFQSDITSLLEQKDALQMRLNEAELSLELLDGQIQQYEVEKMETRKSHEAGEAAMQDEIRQLNQELSRKDQLVDSLNNSLDAWKLKSDMAMAEKDEILAKTEILGNEVISRNISLQQMQEQNSRLTMDHRELVDELQNTQKLVEELRLKVRDQEKELEKQRVTISDRAQEKREAIRQLCFSLEYYRNEYHELRLALTKQHKRSAVRAS